MYAIMPQTPPPRPFGRGQGNAHHYRPTISSPLSSSPIRASSLSPSPPPPQHSTSLPLPLSPCNQNALNALPRPHPHPRATRATQSSPIPAAAPSSSMFGSSPSCDGSNRNYSPNTSASSASSSSSKFRFASRNPRPNPVLKRREDAQDSRRRLFLQNVRQRQEDRRWEMRGGEDELLRLEWLRLNRERRQAREAELARYQYPIQRGGAVDADVVARDEEELRRQRREQDGSGPDADALMADAIAQQEAAEVDALVSALEVESQGQTPAQAQAPGLGSPHFSDDEEYDGLFMDLIERQDGQGIALSQDVEMT